MVVWEVRNKVTVRQHFKPAIFNQCAASVFKTCTSWLFSQEHDFPSDCQIKNMTTANTTMAIWCEWIKIIPIFVWLAKHRIYFLVCHRIFVIKFMRAVGWKRLKITDLNLSGWQTLNCPNTTKRATNICVHVMGCNGALIYRS